VAFVAKQRWDEVQDDDDLRGAPELVIEVLSRSNTPAKIQELAALCLSTGTQELWVIDAKRETVTITSRQGMSMVYGREDRIPLSLFGGDLAVSEIFSRAY
jgi:Uma2 family endonuclease